LIIDFDNKISDINIDHDGIKFTTINEETTFIYLTKEERQLLKERLEEEG
jgi:hypothetical protein